MSSALPLPLSQKQKIKLMAIHKWIQEFYKESDNAFTYAITGLISQLTDIEEYIDPVYLQEKFDIVLGELQKIIDKSNEEGHEEDETNLAEGTGGD